MKNPILFWFATAVVFISSAVFFGLGGFSALTWGQAIAVAIWGLGAVLMGASESSR